MATNAPQDDFHKTGLRLPKDLHALLHEAAAENGRSYNGEIVSRLRDSFDPAMTANIEAERAFQRELVSAVTQMCRIALRGAKPNSHYDSLLAKQLQSLEVNLLDKLAGAVAGREANRSNTEEADDLSGKHI